MKKKRFHQKNTWIGKAHHQDQWIGFEDEQLRTYYALIQQHCPGSSLGEDIAGLVKLGFISTRTNPQGKLEYRVNYANIQAAIDALPHQGSEAAE